MISVIKAVVFDLDHTLFDRYETLRLVVPMFREKFSINPEIPDEYFAKELIWADKNFVHRGWKEIFAHLIKCNIFTDAPTFEEYEAYMISCFKRVAVKYPFAIPTLEKIREMGYKTGLITNSDTHVQEQKLEMLGLYPYLDEIVISGAVGYRKPQKEIFQLMADKLGIETNEMMFVGDHPAFDVDGSRNAGCIPVWVKTTGTWIYPEIEKPELQVETVEEIPEIVLEQIAISK